jgi:L-seryl-tRNA(Ser) seleniumtransferase
MTDGIEMVRGPSGIPYVRGEILASTSDDYTKLQRAWEYIEHRRDHGQPVFNLTGLERALRLGDLDGDTLDDEFSPPSSWPRLRELALEHLGADPGRDDVLVTNRLTAAIYVALQALVRRGSTVVGVSAGYSHPAVVRAVEAAGGKLVDVVGAEEFTEAMDVATDVSCVVLTRLAVTYDALDAADLAPIVDRAHRDGAAVFVDDAGGARVGPAVLGQPRTLQFGADAGATGLDKYGTVGPRLGVLAARADLVSQMRAQTVELGMEARPMLYPAVVHSLSQYTEQRVRDLLDSTMSVGAELEALLPDRIRRTAVTVQLTGEDILAEAAVRAGVDHPAIVPYEATAAVAMLLLQRHGVLTVHFAGLPPGTSALLVKFLPPETVEEFGGTKALAAAFEDSVDRLAKLLPNPAAVRSLLLGEHGSPPGPSGSPTG